VNKGIDTGSRLQVLAEANPIESLDEEDEGADPLGGQETKAYEVQEQNEEVNNKTLEGLEEV